MACALICPVSKPAMSLRHYVSDARSHCLDNWMHLEPLIPSCLQSESGSRNVHIRRPDTQFKLIDKCAWLSSVFLLCVPFCCSPVQIYSSADLHSPPLPSCLSRSLTSLTSNHRVCVVQSGNSGQQKLKQGLYIELNANVIFLIR